MGGGDVEMEIDELEQIKQDVARAHEEEILKQPMF